MDGGSRWILFLVLSGLSFLYHSGLVMLSGVNELRLQRLGMENPSKKNQITQLLRTPLLKQQFQWHVSYLTAQTLAFIVGLWALTPLMQHWFPLHVDTEPIVSRLWSGLGWGSVFLLFGMVLFGVCAILPNYLFAHDAEFMILKLHPVFQKLSILFHVISIPSIAIGKTLAKLLGQHTIVRIENCTEEEIRDLIDVSEEHGEIEQKEREMIHNIFDFDDLDVSEIMTHRTDIVGVEISASVGEAIRCAVEEGFSRLPVYHHDIDNIKGFLVVKDFLKLAGQSLPAHLQLTEFIRKPIFVPEAQKCTDLLRLLQVQKVHMAVVVDDYGGTAGIISMEDLLEAIVGSIQDEYDDEQEQLMKLGENLYLLDGALSIEEVEKLFSVVFDVDEDTTTLGGMIANELGEIPSEGEHPDVVIQGIWFGVVWAKHNRIQRVKAKRIIASTS